MLELAEAMNYSYSYTSAQKIAETSRLYVDKLYYATPLHRSLTLNKRIAKL